MGATRPAPWKKIDGEDPGRLGRLAHFIARHRWAVIGVWVVLTLFGGVAAGKLSQRWYQSFSIPGKPAYEASQRTLKAFGVGVRPPNVVVFHTAGDATKSAAIAAGDAAGRARRCRAPSRARTSRRDNLMYVSRDRHTTFLEVYPPGSPKFDTKSGATADARSRRGRAAGRRSPSTSPVTTRSRRRARTARAAARASCSRR